MIANQRLAVDAPRFSLRKLPKFGELVGPKLINFEWPSQELLDRLPADTTVRTLVFKTSKSVNRVCSVQCKLSNGVESPVFEKAGVGYQAPVTLNFTNDRPVRSIFGRSGATARDRVLRLDFMDQDGVEINSFNPNSDVSKENGSTHQFA